MRKLIGNIRRQPKQRRANIAFGIAASFTLMVVAIWSVNVPDLFTGILSARENTEPGFFDQIGSQAAAVKDSLGEDGETTQSLKELMDGYRSSSTASSSIQQMSATSTPESTNSNEQRETFTTDSSYESDQPKEVRIQTVTSATTSATTSE